MKVLNKIASASLFCDNPRTGSILRTACQQCGDKNHMNLILKLAHELYHSDMGFRTAVKENKQLSLFDMDKVTKNRNPRKPKAPFTPDGRQLSLFENYDQEAHALVERGKTLEKDVSLDEDPPEEALHGLHVSVFRNTTQNCFSIEKPKIPGYSSFKGNYLADVILLKDVSFYVHETSRIRGFLYGLQKDKAKPDPYHKTVHASVDGTVVKLTHHEPGTKGRHTDAPSDWVEIKYNPVIQGDFVLAGTDIPVYSAEQCLLIVVNGKQLMFTKNPSIAIANRTYEPLAPEQQEHFYNELLKYVDAARAKHIVYDTAQKDKEALNKTASKVASMYLNKNI
jgi:hypothetical protein